MNKGCKKFKIMSSAALAEVCSLLSAILVCPFKGFFGYSQPKFMPCTRKIKDGKKTRTQQERTEPEAGFAKNQTERESKQRARTRTERPIPCKEPNRTRTRMSWFYTRFFHWMKL